jgi:hypothetical protein
VNLNQASICWCARRIRTLQSFSLHSHKTGQDQLLLYWPCNNCLDISSSHQDFKGNQLKQLLVGSDKIVKNLFLQLRGVLIGITLIFCCTLLIEKRWPIILIFTIYLKLIVKSSIFDSAPCKIDILLSWWPSDVFFICYMSRASLDLIKYFLSFFTRDSHAINSGIHSLFLLLSTNTDAIKTFFLFLFSRMQSNKIK